jgi:DNA adenine methylase
LGLKTIFRLFTLVIMNEEIKKIKPFLRWAGGKNWLIKHIETILPSIVFNNYHEPFLGGASMFLSIGYRHRSFLSDLNTELIETYIALRDYPEELIQELQSYKNNEKFYYSIRNSKPSDIISKAARFIYLNQTSYNGIFRVNLKGEYNVPYGFRQKDFCEPSVLRNVSLKLQNCHFRSCDFAEIQANIYEYDLVYLDPPYTVSHSNNGFIKYNQKLFSLKDQYKLSLFIDTLKAKGAYYILSNAYHPKIREIFNKNDTIIELHRASLIGGKKASRGQIKEFIFTNLNLDSNDK